ncbi:LLM class flavin-dependent oxidoreductase [bacterium]|nr:LLM class flavin-dependent oxidoreductase [bacterium]
MPRIATISPVWGCSVSDLRELAREAEAGGFEAIFSPEVPPYNGLANAQVFAEATTKIKVGTWITNIYMRQAVIAAATAMTIQEVSGGRMVLGLGVSHKPVNDKYGIEMGDPVEKMKKELEERFKLSKSIATSNLVAFDAEGRIAKYASVEDIMKDFFRVRIMFYEKRKVRDSFLLVFFFGG